MVFKKRNPLINESKLFFKKEFEGKDKVVTEDLVTSIDKVVCISFIKIKKILVIFIYFSLLHRDKRVKGMI